MYLPLQNFELRIIFFSYGKAPVPPKVHPNKFERKIKINKDILIALVSMLGTVVGTFGGILTSSKLTSFRLEQLERKVDKHNNFASRMPVIEEQIKVINHRIDDLEKEAQNNENH